MSSVSLPVTRPSGHALLVSSPSSRPPLLASLQGLGYEVAEADDPYAAMASLCRGSVVQAVILSLASLYREELPVVTEIKRRFPGTEVWLAHTDGRQAALAQALRLGADGLLAEDGLHRLGCTPEPARPPAADLGPNPSEAEELPDAMIDPEPSLDEPQEPILSADELRALLQEPAPIPHSPESEG